MDWLEEELKRALAQQDPPPNFTARVRRRSAGGFGAGAFTRRWLAIAASVVVLTGSGLSYRWYEGVQAKEQVKAAVRLAAGKLNRVRTHIREAGQ